MSYPILYWPVSTEFDDNGIGVLSSCISCLVTEEANGMYELEMKYPMDGIHYSWIAERYIIKAKPNRDAEPQLFRIYSISRQISGIVTVHAEHISYDLTGIPVAPFSAENAQSAMEGLLNNAVVVCPFTFSTDKDTVAEFSADVPGSIRSKLGGQQGSILDVYGGEYEFDNFNVMLHNRRGADRGVSIRYGKNLTNLKQDSNCASVATGVYPYWVNAETGALKQLAEKIIDVEGTFDFVKIKMLDISNDFAEEPTDEQMRSFTRNFIQNNDVGVPSVSLTVSFEQLSRYDDYNNVEILEKISLFDYVSVEFPALGVSTTAKVNKIVYNVLLDRIEKVNIGTMKSKITDTIASLPPGIQLGGLAR